MIKFERSHVYIFVFFALAFLTAVLVMNYRSNKRYKNVQLIEKQHEVNITVERDYYNRGVVIFNDKYCFIMARFKNSDDILNVLNIGVPYKLFKKENNDTIWFSNKDTTLIMVFK